MVSLDPPRVISVDHTDQLGRADLGSKAATLADLRRHGFPVAPGVCVSVAAYREFVEANRLDSFIRMELGRKPQKDSRWEELWDAALRIRSRFMAAPISSLLRSQLLAAVAGLPASESGLAVRSSARDEDGAAHSFAGLHESVLDVAGDDALITALKQVWASMWSDAALLYRAELRLDAHASAMAVLIQPMVAGSVSGVAFSRDPRHTNREHMVIEAVPGACSTLVDGLVDPARWLLSQDGSLHSQVGADLLEAHTLQQLSSLVREIEARLACPVDVEWTLADAGLTVLQARPITTGRELPADRRRYYMTLRPGREALSELCDRVVNELIPTLTRLGEQLSNRPIDTLDDVALAQEIESRCQHLEHWRKIYESDFIPFAHGVRAFGVVYNDLIQPTDPFEFVELLRGESFLASQRNEALDELATRLRSNAELRRAVATLVYAGADLASLPQTLGKVGGGAEFSRLIARVLPRHFDVRYGEDRWLEQPGWVFALLLEMANSTSTRSIASSNRREELERALFAVAGDPGLVDVSETLRVARLSWRLRDDDNLLIGRLESQLLRAVDLGLQRLSSQNLDGGAIVHERVADAIVCRLRGETSTPIPTTTPEHEQPAVDQAARVRQLVGQPASPGFASGPARWIRSPRDVARFCAGEVILCEAIEPAMTMAVPLAAAIVERRGGMLIHGAIIARELGIPCVNGVGGLFARVPNGQTVAVDGYTGLVTVGEAELDRENLTEPESP